MSKVKVFLGCFLIGFMHLAATAQVNLDQVVVHDSIYSTILQEERPLWLIFPKDYKPGAPGKYDILYVIDGEWNTVIAGQVYYFLWTADFMPRNIIIVGIPNIYHGDTNLRARDFTPTINKKELPASGGGNRFLAFLKNELMPYINKSYSTNPERNTLYGSSLGGMFSLYVLLTDPTLFKSYVAVDPGCLWDNYFINKLASEKLGTLKGLHCNLYIGGRLNAYEIMGTDSLEVLLKAKAPEGLNWECTIYPNETHFSSMWKTTFDGFKYAYCGYVSSAPFYPLNRVLDYSYKGAANLKIRPDNGIVLKGKPFKLWCYEWFPDVLRYTTDGAEPGEGSSKMKFENSFSGPVDLRIKSFYSRDEYNKNSFSGSFKIGSVLPAIAKPAAIRPGGLNFKYYEGNWDKLPDFSTLEPVRSGFAGKEFNLNEVSGQTNSSYVLDGYLEVPREGYYIFGLEAGDGFKVYVGNQLLINNKTGGEETYLVPLAKGLHSFRVEYFHKKGGKALYPVIIRPEDHDDIPIPAEWLYTK